MLELLTESVPTGPRWTRTRTELVTSVVKLGVRSPDESCYDLLTKGDPDYKNCRFGPLLSTARDRHGMSMSEGETFNTFWHGDALSAIEQVCMRSFLRHNHGLRVFTYSDVQMPEGVVVEDASKIMPFERLFMFNNSSSAFSNIFRYKLLLERGGWWVDTDILCRKTQMPDCDYYWACEVPRTINGAVLKFPPGDEMCWRLLRLSEERSKNLKTWGQLGPSVVTKVLSKYTPARLYSVTSDVYPIHFLETHFFWLPEFYYEVAERTKNSTFLHFWNSMFARMGIDLKCEPPRGSFLYELYNDYNVTGTSKTETNQVRESIRRYLERDSQREYWSNNFASDFKQLYPLMADRSFEISQMRADLQKAIAAKGDLERQVQNLKIKLKELQKKLEQRKKPRSGLFKSQLAMLGNKIRFPRRLASALFKRAIKHQWPQARDARNIRSRTDGEKANTKRNARDSLHG